jgi:AcrR family transcriptional regulator
MVVQTRSETTRQKILDATIDGFSEAGYAALLSSSSERE